jgi:hypothetical protein
MREIHIGQRLYINGNSQTEELIVAKIGTKYATFSNSPHRYSIEYGLVQMKSKSGFEPSGRKVFISPEDAEYYLEGEMQRWA